MNPERFSTGLVFPFTHKRANPKGKHPDLVLSPEILNPASKVRTLNPKTFAAQTMFTSSTLYRKWRWHDRKSG